MKKLWQIFKGVLLSLVFIGVLLVRVLYMDTLMLDTLEIDVSEHITEEFFIEATEITTYQNILRYQLEEKEKIIRAHPYIQQVEIRRNFPNTLEIKLKERKEYAIIPYNGNYLFVDRDLFLLRISESYLAGEAPVLREIEVQEFSLGDPVITDNDDLVRFTFNAYEALSVSELFPIISEFYLIEDELIIETNEHIDIVFGMDINLPYTIVATLEVYEDLLKRNQRNVSIISKYKDYIYVEPGTFMGKRQSNLDNEEAISEGTESEATEEQEEPAGDD